MNSSLYFVQMFKSKLLGYSEIIRGHHVLLCNVEGIRAR